MKSILGVHKTKLFKNISVVFVWDNIAKIASVITTILLIRFLPQDDYALYTVFNSSLVLFSGVISSGIILSYVRTASEQYSTTKTIPISIFIFAILTCSIIYIVLLPVIFLMKNSLSSILFHKSIYSLPLLFGFVGAISIFLQDMLARFFQVKEEYHKAGILIAVQKNLFLIVIIIIAIVVGLNFSIASLTQISLSLMFAFIMVGVFLRQDFRGGFKYDHCEFLNFLQSSGWLIAYCVCLAIIAQLDVLMVSRFKSEEQVAAYGVATKYYNLLLMSLPSIMTVLRIHTSKIEMVQSLEKQKQFVLKWLKTGGAFFVPIIILVLFFSAPIMRLLNGPQYDAAIMPFKILAISSCFSYLFAPNIGVFMAMKKYMFLFFLGFMALAVNFFSNLFLIPMYDISGAAVATLLSNLLINASATIYILRKR